MIEVLVGMIASGKSAYARERAAAGAVIINDDSIKASVHGGDTSKFDAGLNPLYKSIENHILATAIAMGRDVVIDRGVDVSLLARKRWVSLAYSLGESVCAVEFKVESPEVHAHRRFAHDARGHSCDYWLNVAKQHLFQYKPPTLSEGFCSVTTKGGK